MITENKYYSYNINQLPKGCQYCVRGEKLVIFITGICPRKCCFCPLSDDKYQKDVTFANERKVNDFNDVIKEAELMNAKGAGITGGDPLAKLDRTADYIKKLKEKFNDNFHIHLYTSLDLVNKESLQQLFDAGLDEIRFHPDLDDKKFWKNISLAKQFDWDVGVEIPLIPNKEKETKRLIDFVKDKIDFLNLNELEVSDNEHSNLLKQGFEVKDEFSYAVKGSLELGLKLMNNIKDLNVHLCTAKLKDKVQLSNRIKREAKHSKHSFDIVDKEGLLTRGALYLPELVPGVGYREKLKTVDKKELIEKLNPFYDKVKKKFKLNDSDIYLDQDKCRILIAKKLSKKKKAYFLNLKLIPAVVTEYPTADQLEIEVELFKK
jgi:uncharacterized protein